MNIVADIMTEDVVCVSPNDSLLNAVKQMSEKDIGCVLVFESGKIKGILTERDVIKFFASGGELQEKKVGDVMTCSLMTISPLEKVVEAAKLMFEKNVRRLPVISKGGEVSGILTQKDIVRATLTYFEDLLNSLSIPIFVVDYDHKIRYWNKTLEALTGVSFDEIVGRTDYWKVFYSEYHPTLADIILDGRQEKLDEYYEIHGKSEFIDGAYHAEGWRMGGQRYLTFTASPIKDKQGKITFVVETLQDRTEIAISEYKYRNIVDNANDLILLLNLKGDIIFANDQLEQMYGYMQEEILMEKYTNLIHPDDRDRVTLSIMHSVEMGKPLRNFDALNLKKDGKSFYVDVSASLIKQGERVTGLQLILRDVDEKIRAHKLLQKELNELKELDEAKDDFISITAHELKTPLISLLTIPELILEDEKLTFETRENLEIMLAESRQLKIIVDRILTESRMKANRLNMQFSETNLGSLIEELSRAFRIRAQEKGVDFKIEKPVEPVYACVDSDLIGEVISNLIENALKFTKKGCIKVVLMDEGENAEVSVSDTGIGIPADSLDKIFDKFYQVEHADDRSYGGTGLGLHICKQILERHNGNICVESSGFGTVFTFKIPKKRSI